MQLASCMLSTSHTIPMLLKGCHAHIICKLKKIFEKKSHMTVKLDYINLELGTLIVFDLCYEIEFEMYHLYFLWKKS